MQDIIPVLRSIIMAIKSITPEQQAK